MAKDTDHSIHCNVRGGECYNPTCMLNGKCVDFINRESYLNFKEDEYQKQIQKIQEESALRQQIIDNQRITLSQQWDLIQKLNKDKERLDWMQQMMTPDNDYIEIYLAGLRNFKSGQAESFQIESNPWEKFQSISAPTLREAIDLATAQHKKR